MWQSEVLPVQHAGVHFALVWSWALPRTLTRNKPTVEVSLLLHPGENVALRIGIPHRVLNIMWQHLNKLSHWHSVQNRCMWCIWRKCLIGQWVCVSVREYVCMRTNAYVNFCHVFCACMCVWVLVKYCKWPLLYYIPSFLSYIEASIASNLNSLN